MKIKNVCCYNAALEDISNNYNNSFIRAIASTRQGEITLPNFTEVGNDAIIKSIDEVIKNGTELPMDKEGTLLDRPLDTIPEGILTRVAPFTNEVYMMFVRTALQHVEQYAQNNLVPTLLVYDPEKVIFMGGVNLVLPHDLKERQDSLLQAYLLDSVDCRY